MLPSVSNLLTCTVLPSPEQLALWAREATAPIAIPGADDKVRQDLVAKVVKARLAYKASIKKYLRENGIDWHAHVATKSRQDAPAFEAICESIEAETSGLRKPSSIDQFHHVITNYTIRWVDALGRSQGLTVDREAGKKYFRELVAEAGHG